MAREWKRWPREVEESLSHVELVELAVFLEMEAERERKAIEEIRRKNGR